MKNHSSTSSQWYTFFRFTLAIVILLKTLSFVRDIPTIWFEKALIKTDILSAGNTNSFFGIEDLHSVIVRYFPSLTFDGVVTAAVGIFIIGLLLTALGLFTKINNLIVLIIHLMIQVTFGRYTYGADQFITILLFYLLICKIPENTISLDRFFFTRETVNIGLSSKTVLSIMQAHLCIIYFMSGLEKGVGVNWWNGESISRAVHGQTSLINNVLIDALPYKAVFVIAGWLTIVVEFLYPVFVNIKRTRNFWLVLTIGMHLSIIVCIGLFHFGILMILFNLVTFVVPNLHFSEKEKYRRFSFFKRKRNKLESQLQGL